MYEIALHFKHYILEIVESRKYVHMECKDKMKKKKSIVEVRRKDLGAQKCIK